MRTTLSRIPPAIVAAILAMPVLLTAQTAERSRTQGLKETDRFVKAGESTTQSVTTGKMQLQKTLDAYNSLVTQPSKDMRPGDNSRVHTHPGPEGWYVLAGEQCLETPAGANRARAGGTMTVESNIPMELNVTGTTLRRAFALVIHDSTQERGILSDWKPSGACRQ